MEFSDLGYVEMGFCCDGMCEGLEPRFPGPLRVSAGAGIHALTQRHRAGRGAARGHTTTAGLLVTGAQTGYANWPGW